VRLYFLGFLHEVPDQTFGSATEQAVRELQNQFGQSATGEVTPETWQLVLHAETQAGIQYRYPSPYDALSQINYDLENGVHRDGSGNLVQPDQYEGQLSEDGQYRWDGYEWQPAADGAGAGGFAGQLSDDGQYRWDGTDWQPVSGEAGAGDGSAAHGGDSYAGQLSDDGQYRWDGTDWQPVEGAGTGYVGQLSDDGLWRWDGSQWQAA
jgi:hypothetical protein